jgi:nucleoside recognition membrane protein YjiH
VPSAFGAFLFLTPVSYNGSFNIPLGIASRALRDITDQFGAQMALAVLGVGALATLITFLKKRKISSSDQQSPIGAVFNTGIFWLSIRFAALILGIVIFLEVGPEFIWSKNTGGLMFNSLLPALIPFFLLAGLLLPFLTNFGLMEFMGSIFRPIMRPLFSVPGRAAVDATASWLGSGTMGVVVTDQQYRSGFYTGREAAVIATGFSIVSLPIALLFTEFLDITDHFVTMYAGVLVVGLIVNVVMPRIPPLRGIPDEYYEHASQLKPLTEEQRQGSVINYAYTNAVASAQKSTFANSGRQGVGIVADVWFGLMPIVVVLGTFATVLAEYTPIFTWLSLPLVPVLQLFGIAEASAAAPTLLIGYADVFIPFIIGGSIASIATKVFIGIVAIVQVIFITEVGALILKSPIPLGIGKLTIIFLLRTAIAIPIAALFVYIVF